MLVVPLQVIAAVIIKQAGAVVSVASLPDFGMTLSRYVAVGTSATKAMQTKFSVMDMGT
jgi:uncharacterized linocin/CFP29 family protein